MTHRAALATGVSPLFHRLRMGEEWVTADLDGYRHDTLVVVDTHSA